MGRGEQRQYPAGFCQSNFEFAGTVANLVAQVPLPAIRVAVRVVNAPSPNSVTVRVLFEIAAGRAQARIRIPIATTRQAGTLSAFEGKRFAPLDPGAAAETRSPAVIGRQFRVAPEQ